jgi:hypothetical protein
VFSGDGNYLLGNATAEAPSKQYQTALLDSLRSTLAELQRRFGWRKGDKLRIIFHQSFKRYKETEAEAVARSGDRSCPWALGRRWSRSRGPSN